MGAGPILVLALSALVFALWAIEHHYAYRPQPMLVPATPATAPTYNPDAGERAVPELAP